MTNFMPNKQKVLPVEQIFKLLTFPPIVEQVKTLRIIPFPTTKSLACHPTFKTSSTGKTEKTTGTSTSAAWKRAVAGMYRSGMVLAKILVLVIRCCCDLMLPPLFSSALQNQREPHASMEHGYWVICMACIAGRCWYVLDKCAILSMYMGTFWFACAPLLFLFLQQRLTLAFDFGEQHGCTGH